jgi:hypothetical protein
MTVLPLEACPWQEMAMWQPLSWTVGSKDWA